MILSRRLIVVFAAASLAGCAGTSQSIPTAERPSAAMTASSLSAIRLPPSVLAGSKRQRLDLGTTAFPISALAYPISALAFPISALAFPGAPPAPTTDACTKAGRRDDATRLKSDRAKAVTCKAKLDTAFAIQPDPNARTSAINGVQPMLLHFIYDLPDTGGNDQTVAVVVARDNPQAEADLAVYRAKFGFAPCTTANGCFKKLAGTGRNLPAADAGWSVESSLDLDAVSAACPSCKLMLVEAASDLIPDLANAVDTAVARGATVVSNSYGVAEAADNVVFASHYVHPGVPITAAAGDLAYGAQFPASVPAVTAVGGTSVVQIEEGGIAEVVWPLTGSGCSAFFAKPAWQHDVGCSMRALNDVAMLADPADGIAVYDSTLPGTVGGGWSVIGGTSLAAPLVAAMYALAATGRSLGSNATIYAASGFAPHEDPLLLNIHSGSNGTCPFFYLCNGTAGYNGPTGNGVPWTPGAFAAK